MGTPPIFLLCKTQGRRIATQPFSLYCFVVPRNAVGDGRGGALRHSFIMCLPVGQDVFNLLLCAALAV